MDVPKGVENQISYNFDGSYLFCDPVSTEMQGSKQIYEN